MNIETKTIKHIMALSMLAVLVIAFYYSVNSNNKSDRLMIISQDGDSKIIYYKYDASTNKISKLVGESFENHSSGVFYAKTNSLYFAKRDEDYGFQLYKRRIDSSEEKRICANITDKIEFADFIDANPKDSMLYLRILQKCHKNVQLASYDPVKDEIHIWNEKESNYSYSSISYSSSRNILLTSKFSMIEQEKKVSDALKTGNLSDVNPNCEICIFNPNGVQTKVLGNIKRAVLDADVSRNNRYFLTVETDSSDDYEYHSTPYIKLKDTYKNTSEIIVSNKLGYNYISHARFSSNYKGIYFIATKGNPQVIASINNGIFSTPALYYYDIKTKQVKEVASFKNASVDTFQFIH